MSERQLAVFLDADWADNPRTTSLQLLCELTRSDVVQTHQASGTYPILPREERSNVGDPVLEQALQAYLWLSERYRDGTDVYLFGYGAGGIAALRLARLIAVAGLLRLPNESLVEEVLAWDATVARFPDERLFVMRRKYSRIMPIRFLGLLDPAAPFGLIREFEFLSANLEWIADGRLNPIVSHAFNALAADETSDLYQPVQWTRVRRARFVTQVWFRGSHLGLGHLVSDNTYPLGDSPFERLADEARRRSLALESGWRRDIRRAQNPVARRAIVTRGPRTDVLLTRGIGRIPIRIGRSPRQIGRTFGTTFDDSTSLQTIESVSVPLTGLGVTPRLETGLVALTDADDALFLLNDMKPPLEWFGERSREEDSLTAAQEVVPSVPTMPQVPELRDGARSLQAPPPARFLLAQFRQGPDESLVERYCTGCSAKPQCSPPRLTRIS